MNLLVVEDDRSIREILQIYLCDTQEGIKCDFAANLQESLDCISNKRYDLILLDLLLNNVVATPAIELARSRWPDQPPNICVLSAMVGAEKIANEYNVNCFLSKPFGIDSIEELVITNKRK